MPRVGRAVSRSAVLLTLCIAVFLAALAAWGVGQWRSIWVGHAGASRSVMLHSTRGLLSFTWWEDAGLTVDGWYAGSREAPPPANMGPAVGSRGALGLTWYAGRTDASNASRFGGNRPYWSITCPHWLVAIVAGVYPALWLRRRWRNRYAGAGRCPQCGYDMRATPQRCPECGRAAGKEAA
jgi:hypothetical protein